MKTQAYFGDGVYAAFDGLYIILTANGPEGQHTDRVYLEPPMLEQMVKWRDSGYRDHESGKTFQQGLEEEAAQHGTLGPLQPLKKLKKLEDVVCSRNLAGTTTNVPWTVIWHSPDGFEWGYGGSGPADLALNILNAYVQPNPHQENADADDYPVACFKGIASRFAAQHHQAFKWEFIANAPRSGFTLKRSTIEEWIKARRQ